MRVVISWIFVTNVSGKAVFGVVVVKIIGGMVKITGGLRIFVTDVSGKTVFEIVVVKIIGVLVKIMGGSSGEGTTAVIDLIVVAIVVCFVVVFVDITLFGFFVTTETAGGWSIGINMS